MGCAEAGRGKAGQEGTNRASARWACDGKTQHRHMGTTTLLRQPSTPRRLHLLAPYMHLVLAGVCMANRCVGAVWGRVCGGDVTGGVWVRSVSSAPTHTCCFGHISRGLQGVSGASLIAIYLREVVSSSCHALGKPARPLELRPTIGYLWTEERRPSLPTPPLSLCPGCSPTSRGGRVKWGVKVARAQVIPRDTHARTLILHWPHLPSFFGQSDGIFFPGALRCVSADEA